MTMDIPKEAHKDHKFVFVEHWSTKNSLYDRWFYKCENCGIQCVVGKGFQDNWAYILFEKENVMVDMPEWDVEALSCNDVLIMDILK